MSFTQEQRSNAKIIADTVKRHGLSERAQIIAVMVGITESSLRNVDYGDYPPSMGGAMSSSRGLFQQIKAWGPLSDRMNPVKATEMFLFGGQQGQRGLTDIPGWESKDPWVAAQAVQQSEFKSGSNFKRNYSDAVALVQGMKGNPGSAPQTYPYPGYVIYKGGKGLRVAQIQMQLNKKGANIVPDGLFGPRTDQAVREFQARQGLLVDGKVGPETWRGLFA